MIGAAVTHFVFRNATSSGNEASHSQHSYSIVIPAFLAASLSFKRVMYP